MYSRRLSLYRLEASTFAGDDVLGSLRRLELIHQHTYSLFIRTLFHRMSLLPLNAGQDGGHIVSRTPAVLQDIQAELARAVNVGVEHCADELDARGLVWIRLLEMHHQPECPIFERRVRRSDDNCIPVVPSDPFSHFIPLSLLHS